MEEPFRRYLTRDAADMASASGFGVSFDEATAAYPDGMPSDPTAAGFAACRLKP